MGIYSVECIAPPINHVCEISFNSKEAVRFVCLYVCFYFFTVAFTFVFIVQNEPFRGIECITANRNIFRKIASKHLLPTSLRFTSTVTPPKMSS